MEKSLLGEGQPRNQEKNKRKEENNRTLKKAAVCPKGFSQEKIVFLKMQKRNLPCSKNKKLLFFTIIITLDSFVWVLKFNFSSQSKLHFTMHL